MCKRLLMLAAVLLMAGTAAFADGVGVFDNFTDIGNPKGVGSTQMDYVTTDGLGTLEPRYIITGSGADIWGSADQFQFAYKTITGDVRLTADFQWNIIATDAWAKTGVMLRDVAGGAGAITAQMLARRDNDLTAVQARPVQDSGSWINQEGGGGAVALGIQRLTIGSDTVLQGLVDRGSGWVNGGLILNPTLPDAVGAGIFATSHQNNDLVQAFFTNVEFSDSPELIGIPMVPAVAAIEQCSDVPGFMVRGGQPLVSSGWGIDAAIEFFDTGLWNGLPGVPGTDVSRQVQFVNLHDSGGRGTFNEGNGFPDESYPGIDPFEMPAADTAGGDDDNNFGAEISACVYLTAGFHQWGSWHDDGYVMEVGGVQLEKRTDWNGPHDYWFAVETDGYYSLHVVQEERGGGAGFELHEVLRDGTRILLGDVANGGSPVFVPEPATIALLGLGSLALIRRRKGA